MVGEIMRFRGQDNCPYDRQSGCNNRRGEVSNDTEAKENRGGGIGTAEQVDNSAGAEWYALSTNDFSIPVILFSLLFIILNFNLAAWPV